ncbi:MAG: esterase family protein [Clostridiales bacterium]|jgi:S-formylglutathione hydrolase FrmB|nr:esterase family protein [Clostridiales bacterium]
MACFDGTVASERLGMDVNLRVIMPQNVKEPASVYLLHGIMANYTCWTRYTNIELYANRLGFAVIMPDAGRSFYADMRHGGRYFSFITEELPGIASRMFKIASGRQESFIAGLSMGGYGALRCALSFPENYAAAASFSGVCDITTPRVDGLLADMDEIPAIWGTKAARNKARLEPLIPSASDKLNKINSRMPLFMTCGLDDGLLEANRAFVKLLKDPLPVTYKEWPGGHDWVFWDRSAEMALEFFKTVNDNQK